MSKQDNNSRGWNGSQSHMTTSPSVGRFSNDQTVSLHTQGSSAKFNDNDRTKSIAPYSNHGQHSQQQSSQASHRPAMDIVDLRTAPGTELKATNPATPSHLTQR